MTKVEGRGIIVELRAKKYAHGSLKIEQQEISTKRKASANLVERSFEENNSNKVKEKAKN